MAPASSFKWGCVNGLGNLQKGLSRPIALTTQRKSEDLCVLYCSSLWDFQSFMAYVWKTLQLFGRLFSLEIYGTHFGPFIQFVPHSVRVVWNAFWKPVPACLQLKLIFKNCLSVFSFSPNILLWRFSKLKWFCGEHLCTHH